MISFTHPCECWATSNLLSLSLLSSSSKLFFKYNQYNTFTKYPIRSNKNILYLSSTNNNNEKDKDEVINDIIETNFNLEKEEEDMMQSMKIDEEVDDDDDDDTNVQDVINEMSNLFNTKSIRNRNRKEKIDNIINSNSLNDYNEDFLTKLTAQTAAARPTNNKEDNNDIIIDDYDYNDGVMLDTETYLEYSRMNTLRTREDQEEIQKRSYYNSNRQTKVPKFTTTSMIFDDKYSQYNANDIFDTPQMSPSIPKELLNNNNNAKDIYEYIFQNEKGYKNHSHEFNEFLMPDCNDEEVNNNSNNPWDIAKKRAEAINNATYAYRNKERREQEQNIISTIDKELQSVMQQVNITNNNDNIFDTDDNAILLSNEEIIQNRNNNNTRISLCKVCNCRITLQEVKFNQMCRSCYAELNFARISPFATTNINKNNNKNNNKQEQVEKRQESFTFISDENDNYYNEKNIDERQQPQKKSMSDKIKLQRKQQRHALRMREQRIKEQQQRKQMNNNKKNNSKQ